MIRFGVSEDTIAQNLATPEFRSLLRFEVEIAHDLFARGLPLIDRVRRDLAIDLDLFSRGGLEILRAIEKQDYDVFCSRPTLSRSTKVKLALRAATGRLMPWFSIRGQHSRRATKCAHPHLTKSL
jgi:phytoene/squalene synthetase